MIENVPLHLTHGETAIWVVAFPLLLTLMVLVGVALAGRTALLPLAQRIILRYTLRKQPRFVDPALVFIAPIVTAQQLLLYAVLTLCGLLVLLWYLVPMYLVLVVAPVATVIVMRALLWIAERRYIARLDQALPATVGRYAAMLANGSGFQHVLEKILADLPDGPLKAEWAWLQQRMGAVLQGGGPATPQVVVKALLEQTLSRRHRALLDHLAIALGQTHDILTKRMQAAAKAMHDADRRQSAAATELAQMKYSGFAVGLAGVFMAAYLGLTQWDRFVIAYGNPVGVFAGLIVGAALLAPLVAGVLLARAEETDY